VKSAGTHRTRREVLRDAGAAGALLAAGDIAAACAPAATTPTPAPTPRATPLPPPETTSVRFASIPTCDAPLWLIEEQLRDEGFVDVKFVTGAYALLRGQAEFTTAYANYLVSGIDAGFPFEVVAGVHTGCIELWAAPGITSIRDLRGKTYEVFDRSVGFEERKTAGIFYGFMLSILAHIGIDPAELKLIDIGPDHDDVTDYLEGKSDAIFLPVHLGPLMRRNPKKRGSVILDSTVDRPWSQNYCCMLTAQRDWAKANPVATKRVTRAFLRASDMVAADRKAAVDTAVKKEFYKANKALTPEIMLETISMLSYDWRDFDPEETLRFFALRLRDAKLITKSPQQVIDEGSDLAYFRQLRTELKG
jgi:NitT/TauT family transport system substrate-binding protein